MTTAGAFADLTRPEFDDCLNFVATGGYALRAYDQWQRLKQAPDGTWHLRDPRSAAKIRMNAGTIQDSDLLKVRMGRSRGGKPLGEIEEAVIRKSLKRAGLWVNHDRCKRRCGPNAARRFNGPKLIV